MTRRGSVQRPWRAYQSYQKLQRSRNGNEIRGSYSWKDAEASDQENLLKAPVGSEGRKVPEECEAGSRSWPLTFH